MLRPFPRAGIYFRSNHERLLDELSRAITIIAHGLERLVRDRNITVSNGPMANAISDGEGGTMVPPQSGSKDDDYDDDGAAIGGREMNHEQHPQQQQRRKEQHKLLATHSKCYGPMDELCERRADLLYE